MHTKHQHPSSIFGSFSHLCHDLATITNRGEDNIQFLAQFYDNLDKADDFIKPHIFKENDSKEVHSQIVHQKTATLPQISAPPIPAPFTIDDLQAHHIDINRLSQPIHQIPIDTFTYRGFYKPTHLQKCLLERADEIRKIVQHEFGVFVLPTGFGKTVLCCLDIERDLLINADAFQKQRSPVRVSQDQSQSTSFGDKVRELTTPHIHRSSQSLHFLSPTKRDGAFAKFKNHFTRLGYPGSAFVCVGGGQKMKKADQTLDTFWSSQSQSAGGTRTSTNRFQHVRFVFVLFQSLSTIVDDITPFLTHLITDEAHHLLAPTFLALFTTLVQSSPKLKRVTGLTATLQRRDDPSGIKLKDLFRKVLYTHFSATASMTLNLFPPVEYIEILPTLSQGRDVPTYSQILTKFLASLPESVGQATFEQKTMSFHLASFLLSLRTSLKSMGMLTIQQVHTTLTPQRIVAVLLSLIRTRDEAHLPPRKHILVFCSSCKCSDETAKLLSQEGVSAVSVHSHLALPAIQQRLSAFTSGHTRVICTVQMLQEGWDYPDLDCVVLARVTESETVFLQEIGRGLRKGSVEKTDVSIVDLALNLRRRWHRLEKELAVGEVVSLIRSFWHVSNYIESL
ncbi:putative Type III restriction enzyme, res subunit [Blattamonas nauphoetae]|uniref:Type III restriction enzyme, res subunit n=1 Tax=Blattamonas nauphoetae TaxID=2049346 RepID=A0ABQ9XNM9_9EUKA|nr:putative Type III restriction enzyme, res subunit [Blattamonas nauphoetae]